MRTWLLHATFFTALLTLGGRAVDAAPGAGVADLLRVQESVQQTLTRVRPMVVAIETIDGTASGVLISKDGLILTAAHVAEEPGKEMRVVLENGDRVKAVTLGLDTTTDAALMRMLDKKRKWPFVQVARNVAEAQPGEWCFALGHPGGFDKDRGVVLRVGKVIKQTANSLQTDCVLMGGDSGGPLFNLAGEVIGIHSQIWEGRDENMHVSMAPFLRSWEAMKASKVIRVWSSGSGGFLGVRTEASPSGGLVVMDIIAGSPAAKAGVKAGDVILGVDSALITDQPQFSNAVRVKAAGDIVNLRLRSAGEEREITVTLGHKPNDEG